MAERRRVAITGLGAVTPVGLDMPTSWDALLAGRSGIGPITRFDASEGFTTRIAGEVKGFDPADVMDRKEVRRNDPFVWYAMKAAVEALTQAGLPNESVDPNRIGVIIGSGIGGLSTWEAQHATLLDRGPGRVSPFFVPMMITNMAAGAVSMRFNARGPNYCVTSACASGAHAIGEAFRTIQNGKADAMIAGGSEASVTRLSIAGFCSAKAMSTRNEEPARASRPFDKERDGFVLSEGAAIAVLETFEHARARGAKVLGEMIGYGTTGDAYHMTAPAPEGEGAARAMKEALDDAGIPPADVQYINAHGTSTPLNDKFETMAIRRVFGNTADGIPVSSTKSMTGHLLGAAGAFEFLVSAKAVAEGVLPPTINFENPDPECDLDYVPNEARKHDARVAISNSLGFGGHNVTLVVRRHPAD